MSGKKSGGVAISEAIYKTYPRKLCKREALRAITNAVQRLIKGESGELMEQRGAEAFLASKSSEFAKSPAGNKGEFTPYPATWFNKSRYLDDTEEWNRGEDTGQKSRQQECQQGNRDTLTAALRNRYGADGGEGSSEAGEGTNNRGVGGLGRAAGAGTGTGD